MQLVYREGGKQSLAKSILPYIPSHKVYVELFFGAGGLFFNKPLAPINILNDLDKEIFNLYTIIKDKKDKLIEQLELLPNDQNLFLYWKKNKETDNIQKAVRFLYLTNYSYMGTGESFHTIWDRTSYKENLIQNIENVYVNLVKSHSTFFNMDFRKVIDSLALKTKKDRQNTFIYADPPYLNTRNRYNVPEKWNYNDSKDLFDILIKSGCKFLLSEFDNPLILELAESHKLRVIELVTRQALKAQRNEILITNMKTINNQPSLF